MEQEIEYEHEALDQFYDEAERKNNRVLKALESIKGAEFVEDVKAWIKSFDDDSCSVMPTMIELENKPVGHKRRIDIDFDFDEIGLKQIKHQWIHQYENGGMSGDSYSGYAYIKIRENKFLKIHYSM